MTSPFIGEIRMVGFNFAPQGWADCDGQLLAISSNDALFSLLGTMYGGDGRNTFGLPDLRGRQVLHKGSGPGLSPRIQGQAGGAETVTLNATTLPSHTHTLRASSAPGTSNSPAGAYWAAGSGPVRPYRTGTPTDALSTGAISSVGGSQPHENMPPFLTVRFVIALAGIYPSRT